MMEIKEIWLEKVDGVCKNPPCWKCYFERNDFDCNNLEEECSIEMLAGVSDELKGPPQSKRSKQIDE